MGKQQKRSRKKEFRAVAMAQREAELRRRRAARLIGIGLVLALVVGLALFAGGDEGGEEPKPSPSEEVLAACGAEPPPPADPQQYESPPDLTLPEGVDYRAVVHTSCGDIEMDLLEDKAPQTVANFVFLANEGFYDGLIWHRVESNAVIQTGDPNGFNGQPPDGPGYSIDEEPPKKGKEYVYGTVGMANAGPGTTGSQWFIVVHEPGPAGYDPLYSLFAIVDESSRPTIDEIQAQPTDIDNPDPAEAVKPLAPIFIESIEIIEA